MYSDTCKEILIEKEVTMQRVDVPSSSCPNVVYEVAYNDDHTSFTCNCRAGMYNRLACRHVKSVKMRLGASIITNELTDLQALAMVVTMLDETRDTDTVASLKDAIEKEYSGLLKRVVKFTNKDRIV